MYKIACSCGERIVVTATQAGADVRCSCGQLLRVPSLSRLNGGGTDDEPAEVVAATKARIASPRIPADVCPYCGGAMQAGAILGDRYQLKWLPSDKSLALGIWALNGEPIGEKQLLQRPRVEGMRCENCRKIIVTY